MDSISTLLVRNALHFEASTNHRSVDGKLLGISVSLVLELIRVSNFSDDAEKAFVGTETLVVTATKLEEVRIDVWTSESETGRLSIGWLHVHLSNRSVIEESGPSLQGEIVTRDHQLIDLLEKPSELGTRMTFKVSMRTQIASDTQALTALHVRCSRLALASPY